MTKEHFNALLSAAETKPGEDGWSSPGEERLLTLHVSHDGVGLTVGRVAALKLEGELVLARNTKGDQYVLSLDDLFAASVEGPKERSRQAGFR